MMMRTPVIAGNWKLNNNLNEAKQLATELVAGVKGVEDREIIIAPVFTALASVAEIVADSNIGLAAQNCYPSGSGAYTGEVSPEMLKDCGCHYVILGHSERRQLLAEDDAFINSKVHKALEAGLQVILCVGETLKERESEMMLDVLKTQVSGGLAAVTAEQMEQIIIAYEPVWAIGTGKTATNEQAQEIHSFIRGLLQGLFSPEVASATRILYGGSVKPANVDGLMSMDDIDGALVGGASLKSEDFIRLVKFKS
jgi:triosephosphate isomerase